MVLELDEKEIFYIKMGLKARVDLLFSSYFKTKDTEIRGEIEKEMKEYTDFIEKISILETED